MKMNKDSPGYLRAVVSFLIAFSFLPAVTEGAAKRPSTMAELALYQGADRQQILVEGAKKEGKLNFYTSGILKQAVRPVVEAFEKKYPFLKVEIWRASGAEQISRTVEEFKSRRHLMDAMESTQTNMTILKDTGIAQPFWSPQFPDMEEEGLINAPGGGAYSAAFRSSGIGFGYNTRLLKESELPKSYQDLADPRWKGKLAIAGSDTGVSWAECIYRNSGEELLKKIAEQNFAVHMVSASALLDLVVNGEYPASPTIFDSHVFGGRKRGAPVAWVPLEPVYVNVGQIALARHAPHPHAALLFADFEISRTSAEIHRGVGYDNFRKDVPPLAQKYKKYFGPGTLAAIKEKQEIFNRLFVKK